MASPSLHSNLEKIRFLVGTWRGTGKGVFPTIKSFEYKEEISFSHVGRPFLLYSQKTSDASTSIPLHAECGYLRAPSATTLELVLAQPSGVASVEVAEVDAANATTISLSCTEGSIIRTPSAKHPWVKRYTRTFVLIDGNTLSYTMAMETENQPFQNHLTATLTRVQL
jgi:hypothetical protein